MSGPTYEWLVTYVRMHYVDRNSERWEDPASRLADTLEAIDGYGPNVIIHGLIERSVDSKLEFDALILIAERMLRSGALLPEGLREWTGDVLIGKRARPKKGPQSTSYRDHLFCLAVRELQEEFEVSPTHSPTSGGFSGCEVVAEASGYNYKTVEAVWGRRSEFFRS